MGDYHFLTLKDALTCINQKVNIIAIVAEFSPPQKSRRTDYFCQLKIIDESHYMSRISMCIFALNIYQLPLVSFIGDIIYLSRVTMTIKDGDVGVTFKKESSSFALYDGKYGENFHPYQVSLGFTRNPDENRIADLRNLLETSEIIDVVPNFLLLREIHQVGPVNLACKVLHICKTTNNKWMVFLWDGTDAPPNMLEDKMRNPLSLNFEPLHSSRDVIRTFPTVGSILRVILHVERITYTLQMLKIGQWLKLFRVSCKVYKGLWYGVFTSSSMIREMPNNDIEIRYRRRNYNRRLLNELDRMPYWSCPWPSRITEVNCGNEPFSTLMDVLTCEKALTCEKVKKFRCVIRFVGVMPLQVEDFRTPGGTYKVRFTLEDPTARIHAFAYAKEGFAAFLKEKFFDGSSTDVVKQKLIELLGVPIRGDGKEIIGGGRNPPWVQCCLKLHNLNKWRWICDTKLIGFKSDTC